MSDSLWHDLRFSMRSFNRARSFALLAILALALGIGSTTTIFSVIQNTLPTHFPIRGPTVLSLSEFMIATIAALAAGTFIPSPSFWRSKRGTMYSKALSES